MLTSIDHIPKNPAGEKAAFLATLRKPIKASHLKLTLKRILYGTPNDTVNGNIGFNEKLTGGNGETLKVLLVEDNIINQKVAEKILEKVGCSVIKAENGISALELLQKNEISLILMDLHMPEMDGWESTKIIREQKGHKNTPIIAMTADAMMGIKEKCVEIGMNDYLAKPFTANDFRKMVKKWV